MKVFLLSFFYFFTNTSVLAQPYTALKHSKLNKFFNDIKPFQFSEQKIIVNATISQYLVKQLLKSIKTSVLIKKTLQNGKVNIQLLTFSKQEKVAIKKNFNQPNKSWLTNSHNNILITNQPDSFANKIFYTLYNFTEPLFLKNNTICIFYQDYACGNLCGGGNLSIYIKANGKWKREWYLYNWVS
jgi:hypothetical protein